MRFAIYLLLLGTLHVTAVVDAQIRVDLDLKNVTLHDVLWELQKQSGFVFVYSTSDVESVRLESVSERQKSVHEILDNCLRNTGLGYDVHNEVIVIRKVEGEKTSTQWRDVVVKGKVRDKEGNTLPGVSVQVKGTHSGVATDMDGNFELRLPDTGAVLIFSFVGMKTREIAVPNDGREMTVVLEADAERLEEVIVTGYGTFKKSAYAGSASTVKTQTLKDIPAVSFSQVLQGAAPGIQISAGSGQPGASTSINIRGMGSFNASNSPLYVIDGVPMISGDVSALGTDAGFDVMATLNTSDIENITVIKDAAAAALYGSRAANGVILITTKSGQKGKPVFSFKADWGFSDFAMEFRPTIGGEERRNMIYQALKDGAMVYEEYSEESAIAYADEYIDYYAPVPWCGYTDWRDIMFRKGSHQTYEFSAAGGTDKLKYYSSLAYLKQEGITMSSGLERVSGRLNVDYTATDKLTLGAKMLFSNVSQDVYSEGTSYTAPFYAVVNCVVPSDPVYNEDGTWNRDFIRNDDRNPKLADEYNFRREYIIRSFNTIYASYDIIRDLNFKSTLSYDFTTTKGRLWYDPRTSDGDNYNGALEKSIYEQKKMVWSNVLSYRKTFNDKHNLDLLVGYEIDDQSSDYLMAYVKNFARSDKPEISNGVEIDDVSGSSDGTRLVSYISRLNYNYDNKYYFGASYRMDGSSRLHRDSRWGSFWSVSGAWKIASESFMQPASAWLSDLKLRLSYGVNGTLPSDYYGYMGLSSLTSNYNNEPGIAQSQLQNLDLSWETNYNLNFGLDFGFWNRLNFTLEYYTRTTKDLLMDRPISMTTGFGSYLMNIGEVKNRGVELEVRSVNFDRDDFSWTTTFNLGHNKNKIVRLDGQQTEIASGSQIRKVGLPYRTFYLIEFAGINPDNGRPQFYTNDGDSKSGYIKEIT
ncbi:TonB-dependent receptor, partial [Odoribacter splanchnicus]